MHTSCCLLHYLIASGWWLRNIQYGFITSRFQPKPICDALTVIIIIVITMFVFSIYKVIANVGEIH